MNNHNPNFKEWINENILEVETIRYIVFQKSEYAGAIAESRNGIFFEKSDAVAYADFLKQSILNEVENTIKERLDRSDFKEWFDFYDNYDSDSIEVEIWDSLGEKVCWWILTFDCDFALKTIQAYWEEIKQ